MTAGGKRNPAKAELGAGRTGSWRRDLIARVSLLPTPAANATAPIRAAGLPTEVVNLTFYDDLLSQPAHQAGAFAYLVKGCSVALMRQVIEEAWRRAAERSYAAGRPT